MKPNRDVSPYHNFRPLSKTVRFNVLKVIPAGSSGLGKKAFTAMWYRQCMLLPNFKFVIQRWFCRLVSILKFLDSVRISIYRKNDWCNIPVYPNVSNPLSPLVVIFMQIQWFDVHYNIMVWTGIEFLSSWFAIVLGSFTSLYPFFLVLEIILQLI